MTHARRPSAPQPSRVLWLDATAGVAGDMLVGALVDLGVPLEVVVAAVEAVLPDTVDFASEPVLRAGLRATKVHVRLREPRPAHNDDGGMRRWSSIRRAIQESGLPTRVAALATASFAALAEVEAQVHGVAVDDVHFHEVGAWDSVADVVGVCAAVHHLRVDEVVVSRVAVGSGTVRTAHGTLPVPVPAVVGLATGWEVVAGGEGELATPTGMALVTSLATAQGPLPALRLESCGAGAGTADPAGRPNVVRALLGVRTDASASPGDPHHDLVVESLVLLEANVDDLDPRLWPGVVDVLLAAGAADAWLVPVVMKRGRPAHTLTVLAHPQDVSGLRDLVFAHTSTIGVRELDVRRSALSRAWATVSVDGLEVRVKVAHRRGRITHATPEFRDVQTAASRTGRPERDVLEAAVAAAITANLVPGAPAPPPN